jgi:TetR/AcrR family transcriptional repressor of nem operon
MMFIMRYPEGHKEAVRERIVAAASAALRRQGLSGVSIPELMKSAGLTHGGFYTHFANRDELVAEAIKAAAASTADGVFADDAALKDVLSRYLSMGHVLAPEAGCVVAALGPEGSRQSARVRKAFANAARGLLLLVERRVNPTAKRGKLSEEGLRLAATMVGAVVLARMVDDSALANRILAAARASAAD